MFFTRLVGVAVGVVLATSLSQLLVSNVWTDFPALPGTSFCGARNAAGSGELSTYNWERDKALARNEVDQCCLRHDYCDRPPFDVNRAKRSIAVFPGFYVGHCDCDDALLDCLRDAKPAGLATIVQGIFSFSFCYHGKQGDGIKLEWLLWRTMQRHT